MSQLPTPAADQSREPPSKPKRKIPWGDMMLALFAIAFLGGLAFAVASGVCQCRVAP